MKLYSGKSMKCWLDLAGEKCKVMNKNKVRLQKIIEAAHNIKITIK